jgi:O-antigen ligase
MSSLWSPIFALTIVRGLQLLIIFTLVFVSLRVLGVANTLKTMAISLIVYVLLFASMALVFSWAGGGSRSLHGFTRFTWFGVNPIASANWIAMSGVLVIAMYLNRKHFWSRQWMSGSHWLWLIPVMAFLIYVMIATHSRGALIAFVGTVVGIWVFKKVQPSFALTVGGLAVVFLVFLILGSGMLSGFSGLGLQSGTITGDYLLRGHTEQSLLTLTGRTDLWMDMFELIANKPILGHGYLSTRVILPYLRDWSAYAHNGFMQTLFDLGIVGIILLWYPVLKSVMGCLRYIYEAPPPQCGYFNVMLGVLVYILLYAMLNESFSGVPTYDQVVTFTCVLAYERLYYQKRDPVATADVGYARS